MTIPLDHQTKVTMRFLMMSMIKKSLKGIMAYAILKIQLKLFTVKTNIQINIAIKNYFLKNTLENQYYIRLNVIPI